MVKNFYCNCITSDLDPVKLLQNNMAVHKTLNGRSIVKFEKNQSAFQIKAIPGALQRLHSFDSAQ